MVTQQLNTVVLCRGVPNKKAMHIPKPIYLDYMATTPAAEGVVEAVAEVMRNDWGNPHSDHSHGMAAGLIVEEARSSVATLVGANSDEVLFTSGATEANNLAIKGVMTSGERRGDHVIVSSIEHKCVLEAAHALERAGVEVTKVGPGPNGLVEVRAVEQALRPDTALVSIMHANNETGVIQPIQEIAALCRRHGTLFHTDAAQTVGKIEVDFLDLRADLLSLSGHKFYGPKGIGALIISNSLPVRLTPLLHGGGQQANGRSGTVPTALCAGLAEASALARANRDEIAKTISHLRDQFEQLMTIGDSPFSINPHGPRIPGCTNLRADGVNAEDVLLYARNALSASTGSACNSGNIEPSYVLMAQGLTYQEASSSIRIGIGRQTTLADIEHAARALREAFEKAYRAAA